MKIGYLTHDMDPKAGWGRYASDLVMGIKKSGHEAVILKERDDGFDGIPVLKRGAGMFLSAIKVRKYFKDCDIVHAFDVYPYGIIAWLANMFLNKKLMITALGTYSVAPLYNPKTRWLSGTAFKSAEAVIAISNFTRGELLKREELRNVFVINPGINFQNFHKTRQESSENFILSVGALKFRKGYHISIPAFALAKKQQPNLKYKIVGDRKDSNYFASLAKIAKDHGVETSVEFLENIPDEQLNDLYSRADVFVLTSVNNSHHFEGYGLVFLEAAAAGLPVIGTRGNGIEDAVWDGYNGILVSQNNIQGTADAIISILSDSVRFAKMSQESYEWARWNDLSGVIPKYLDAYKALL